MHSPNDAVPSALVGDALARGARACALTLALAGLGGCFDAQRDAPRLTASECDEIARALGSLVADDRRGQPSAFGGAVSLAHDLMPRDFTASGDFVHADLLGFEYSLAAVCSDDAGRWARCGVEAALAHVEAAWSGAWSLPRMEVEASFDGDWILQDLAGDVVALNGRAQGSLALAVRGDGRERAWALDYRAAYADVGIDARTRRAVSGAVHYRLQVERTSLHSDFLGARAYAVAARLDFHAEGGPVLTLDERVYRLSRDGSATRVTAE